MGGDVFCVVIVVTSMYLVLYVSVIVCGGGDVWPGSHSPLSKWRRKKGLANARELFSHFLQKYVKRHGKRQCNQSINIYLTQQPTGFSKHQRRLE